MNSSLYLALKALHVAAVVIFLGNIATGMFWKAHADRTADPHLIAHALAGIIRSDRWFTIPGVLVILLAGFGAAGVGHFPLLGTSWILWSLVFFSISGIAFMWQVVPLQRRMLALACAAEAAPFDWALYRRVSRQWELWGAAALLTSVAALVLMVTKPRW